MSSRSAFGWILLAAVSAHGLLPLCTIVVSDDWFTLLAYKQASFAEAWRGAVFLSMPLTVLQALPFFLIGDNLVLLRTIDFLVVVALGQTVFLVLAHLAPTRKSDALWVALLAVTMPGYLVYFMVSFLFYPLGLLLFLTALWLVLVAEESESLRRRKLLFALVAGLVFYSFHFGALLVFFVFFVVAHGLLFWRRSGQRFLDAAVAYLSTRYWLLALPLLFWILRQIFGLLLPTWEQYNQPNLAWPVLREGLAGFLASYRLIFQGLFATPWFWVPLAAGGCWVLIHRRSAGREAWSWRDVAGTLVGVLILLAGILPFILVGKSPLLVPQVDGGSAFKVQDELILALIDTRMHLFLGIAVGFIAVHGIRLLVAFLRLDRRWVQAFLLALLIACVARDVSFYLALEKRAIVIAGVREQLRSRPELKDYQIFGVVDRIGNISTTWDSWVLFFETVWGDRAHFGVPELWYGAGRNSRLIYNPATIVNRGLYGGAWYRYFQTPRPEARQATIIISPGDRYFAESDAGAVLLGLYYRLFSPSRQPGYLRKFARVTLLPKVDAIGNLRSASFGANWQDLSPQNATSDEQGWGERAAPIDEWALARREARSQVLFVVDRPARRTEIESMALANQEGKLLPGIKTERSDGTIVLLGVVGPGDQAVRLVDRNLNMLAVFRWRVLLAKQQHADTPEEAWWIQEPYREPEALYPASFRGTWQADESDYLPLLRDPVRQDGAALLSESDARIYLESEKGVAEVRSHLIPIDGGAQRYLRVDWGDGSTAATWVRITDPDGRRLLELKPPKAGGVSDYIVPVTPAWSSVRVAFVSPTGARRSLPRSVEIVQAPLLPSLGQPVASLFSSTASNSVPTH